MRVISCFLVFICVVSSSLAYETPGLEVIILIKGTGSSVDSNYFSSQIVPLIETISKELIFPEDVSVKQREFSRISVSVGGTSDDWPAVSLRNQSRSEFLASLKKLSLVEGQPNVGNVDAIESAIKTLYDSSVAIYRLVVLLTDEVLMTDSESDDAKRLLVITDHRIYIIGIPSIQNSTFNASMPAAIKLTAEPDNVFGSISEALSRPQSSITDVMNMFMVHATRICRRILFLYENSIYVDMASQKDFIDTVSSLMQYFQWGDNIALVSFDDILNDRLVFILAGEVPNWHVKPSNTYNVSHGDSVYDKLVEISRTPDFPFLDIILLAQADVLPQNTTNSMFDLADQQNVNVFVYDDSQNPASSLIFQILTKNKATRIFNVYDNDEAMAKIYADNIYPILTNQDCDNSAPSNPFPIPGVSVPTITAFDSTTTQAIQATTSVGHYPGLPLTDIVFIILVGICMSFF